MYGQLNKIKIALERIFFQFTALKYHVLITDESMYVNISIVVININKFYLIKLPSGGNMITIKKVEFIFELKTKYFSFWATGVSFMQWHSMFFGL